MEHVLAAIGGIVDVYKSQEFYGSCYKALKDDGIMVYQHGSPFYDEDELELSLIHISVS